MTEPRRITVRFPDRFETRTEKELDYLHEELWNVRHPTDYNAVADEVAVFSRDMVARYTSALALDWDKRTFHARYRPAPPHLRRAIGDLELDSVASRTMTEADAANDWRQMPSAAEVRAHNARVPVTDGGGACGGPWACTNDPTSGMYGGELLMVLADGSIAASTGRQNLGALWWRPTDIDRAPMLWPLEPPLEAPTGARMTLSVEGQLPLRMYNEADYELLAYLLRHGWQGNAYLNPSTGVAIVTDDPPHNA